MLNNELISKIESGSHNGEGRECKYFRLNEREGLKTFVYEEHRDHCFDMQTHCRRFGLAPMVGDTADIPTVHGLLYGYTTEHLQTCLEIMNECDKNEEPYPENIHYTRREGLTNVYAEHGLNWTDTCTFNIGVFPSGELCAIDFGDVRFVDDPGVESNSGWDSDSRLR